MNSLSSDSGADDVQMQDDNSSASSSDTPFDSKAQIEESQHKTATKISELTTAVNGLFETNSDGHDAILHDPIRVYDEMSQACAQMKSTWEEHRSDLASIEKEKEAQSVEDNKQFREVYMNMVTDAFSDELDDLRHGIQKDSSTKKKKSSVDDSILQQDNIVIPEEHNNGGGNVDMEILADMLESGMEGWSTEEKELLLKDWNHSHSEQSIEESVDDLTPHEQNRKIIFGK
eukprot:scaffold3947_cov222-Chaetoceros_neogracile.AAC.4